MKATQRLVFNLNVHTVCKNFSFTCDTIFTFYSMVHNLVMLCYASYRQTNFFFVTCRLSDKGNHWRKRQAYIEKIT